VFIDDGARLALSMIATITARGRLVLEATHAAARLDQRFEIRLLNLPARSSAVAADLGCRCGGQNLC